MKAFTLPMLMRTPWRFRRLLMAYWVSRSGALRFRWKSRSKNSGVKSSTVARELSTALLTRTSTPPNFFSRALLIAAAPPVLRELLPEEFCALPQVVHADLDRRALSVLDRNPAVVARAHHRREDPVVVVEALPDHAVLHELRVAVL